MHIDPADGWQAQGVQEAVEGSSEQVGVLAERQKHEIARQTACYGDGGVTLWRV